MTRNVRRRSALGLAACGVSLILSPFVANAQAQTRRIRRSSDFRSFDPAFFPNIEDEVITINVLAPLVRYKKRENTRDEPTVQPHLLSSWERDEDGKVYRVTLRQYETWKGGGRNIESSDVEFSFRRIAANAQSRHRGIWSTLDRVEVIDPSTFRIHLSQGNKELPRLILPRGYASIVSKDRMEANASADFGVTPPDISGRYGIVHFVRGDRLVLEARSDWRGDRPQITRAEFVVIPNDASARAARDEGRIDVVDITLDVIFRGVATAEGDRRNEFDRHDVSSGVIRYLALLPQGPARLSPEARRGIQVGIDEAALIESVYQSIAARPALGFVPIGWPGALLESQSRFNFDEARRLLQDTVRSGQVPRLGYFISDVVGLRLSEHTAGQLQRLGLRTELVPISPENWGREFFANGNVDLVLGSASVWQTGLAVAYARFSRFHPVGLAEVDFLVERAQFDSSVFQRLNFLLESAGRVRFLLEERVVWQVRRPVIPAFAPNGQIGDLGDWRE